MKKPMEKTEYITMTSWSMTNVVHRRVYADEDGKRYIKDHGEYKCIENTPCIKYLQISRTTR